MCILTSFIPEKLKDLGSLCCSMLGGSSGGRVEGLNENGENELKTSGPLLHFSLFFFSSLFFPTRHFLSLSLNKSDLTSKTNTSFVFGTYLIVTVFLDRSYLYNRLLQMLSCKRQKSFGVTLKSFTMDKLFL